MAPYEHAALLRYLQGYGEVIDVDNSKSKQNTTEATVSCLGPRRPRCSNLDVSEAHWNSVKVETEVPI